MLQIDSKNRITLTRGDTAVLKLYLKDARDKSVNIGENCSCILTVKENTDTDSVLIQITAKDGSFTFLPEHTKHMKYGNYVYDVQVTMDEGNGYTVIPPSRFTIGEEVTW